METVHYTSNTDSYWKGDNGTMVFVVEKKTYHVLSKWKNDGNQLLHHKKYCTMACNCYSHDCECFCAHNISMDFVKGGDNYYYSLIGRIHELRNVDVKKYTIKEYQELFCKDDCTCYFKCDEKLSDVLE